MSSPVVPLHPRPSIGGSLHPSSHPASPMLASPRTSAPPTNGTGTGPSSPRGNSLDEIKRWAEADVAAWLSSHNLAHHAPTFARNDINGNVLMDVDQAALKDMGIATVGDRIRLFSAIKQLRKRCTESASYLNRMAAMRVQQQDRQARYRATYTTPDLYGIQIQEATLDQQLNGNQPSPVTNDAGQSKKRGSQMRPPPLRLSGSSASNIPSTPPPYPSPNSLSAFHSGQGLGLSQARGLTPGSAANRTPNPANVGQGRSPIPASFRNLEATTSNSRSSSPISMHRKTNSAVGGSMLTQGNASSMGVQPRQFGSYNGQPNYPGGLHSSSAVPITPSPTSTIFDARGISRPSTAESATRDTGRSMSISGSAHGAASGYGSASGSGPIALTASTSTVGAAAAPPLTPITEANSSIYSSGYGALGGSNSSSGYSRSRPMGHAGHTASSSSSYGSRTIPYGDIPRPSLEDLKRRTIKFIGDDGTTRIINVSDCRDAHDVLSKVLKKFGKSTAGNGYLPTLGQQPLPNNGEARYVIVATSSEGATRDLRPEELLAICHAPQPYDPLRDRGLTLRRISPGASGMDASHASASTTATRRMARSGRNKLEAFFGERLQDGPYPVDGSSLAGDVGQVTTAGKKMNRASTVSILTGLGAGALASIAGSPIGPSSPPLPSADSGSLRDRTISRNGGLARPTSSSHRATLNPASLLPRKARNFMGQRPPSELISSHLADYFPATEKKILERTARRSIAGRASASIKSSNKRDSTWSYHPGLSEQDEEQEMPPPLPTKYRAGEPGSTAPMLPPVVISHNSLDDPMDDWSQNLRGAGTPDPSAADAASPGAQYATVKQQRSSRPPLGSSRASIDSARSRKSYASQLRAARGLTAGASSSANSFRTRPSSTFNDAASMMTVDEITQEVENRRASRTMSILGDQEDGGANWVVDEDGNPIPIGPAGRSGGSSSRRLKKSSTASPSLNTRPSSGHSIDYSVEEEGSQQDSSSDILPGEEDGDDDISIVGPGPVPASAVLERASPEAPEASSADTGYMGTETDEDLDPSSEEEEDSDEDEEEGVISEAQVATAATTTTLASSASPNTGNKKASSVTGKPQMKWIKGALIGAGSFGSVFLAMNGKTGLLMAVKQVELPSGQTANDQKKKRMLDALEGEIELLKELQHENIVQYLDSYADGTHLNIFLEYVPGGSVVALLRNYGAFEEPLVRNFVKQILQGLSFLHGKDIVHRDIKGANILVDNKSCIKISDFGISKKVESDLLSDARSHRPSLQGSVFWMAPEVVKQTSYTLKADIWSLGCLVVEMMSGTHPFPNLNQMQALFRIGSGNSRPSLPEEISDMAKDFLDRTFEMDHEKRPTSETLLKHPFITEDYVPPVEGSRKVEEEEEDGEEEDE